MSPDLQSPIPRPPFYRRRWFTVSIISILGVLLVMIIVALSLFFMWWNSPEKALIDVADYAARTPGSYTVTSHDTSLDVTIRDNEYAMSGTLSGVPLSAVLFGNTLWLKSSEFDKVYNLFMNDGKNAPMPPVIQSIIPLANGKWISINLQTFALSGKDTQASQCIFQERQTVAHDPNARRQWAMTYIKYRFLDVLTTKKPTMTTYTVSINEKQRTGFFAALQKTGFYQSLTDCTKTTDILGNLSGDPIADITTKPGKRILQSLVIHPGGADRTTITARYTDVPQISLPTDTVNAEDLFLRYLESAGSPTNL